MKTKLKLAITLATIVLASYKTKAQTYADPYSQGIGNYLTDQPVGTVQDITFNVGNGASASGAIMPNTVEWTINFPNNILNNITIASMPAPFYESGRSVTTSDVAVFIRTNGIIPVPTIFTSTDYDIHYTITGTIPDSTGGITLNNRTLPGSGAQGNNDVNNDNAYSPIRFTKATNLPIQLINFTANVNNCIAQFNWETGNEVNFNHFELQKKVDNTYSTIATIAAKGSFSKYSYNESFKGTNVQYRLKMVDNDNKTSYADINSLSCVSTDYNVSLYPNPTASDVTVAIDKDNYTQMPSIEFYNAIGQKVSAALLQNVGNKTLTYSLAGLPAGYYTVSINDNAYGKSTYKVVKK